MSKLEVLVGGKGSFKLRVLKKVIKETIAVKL